MRIQASILASFAILATLQGCASKPSTTTRPQVVSTHAGQSSVSGSAASPSIPVPAFAVNAGGPAASSGYSVEDPSIPGRQFFNPPPPPHDSARMHSANSDTTEVNESIPADKA